LLGSAIISKTYSSGLNDSKVTTSFLNVSLNGKLICELISGFCFLGILFFKICNVASITGMIRLPIKRASIAVFLSGAVI